MKSIKTKIITVISLLIVIAILLGTFFIKPTLSTNENEEGLTNTGLVENLNTEERIEEFEKAAKSSMSFDYNDLSKKMSYEDCKKSNPDTKYVLSVYDRWFPVMEDKDGYYDRRDFNKRSDVIGTPYVYDSLNYKIIFGHSVWGHQFDLMFTFLERFADKDFWKENRVLNFEGEDGDENYLVVAVVNLDINSDPWSGWLSAEPIMEDFTKWVKENALVTYDDNFNSNNDYLVLCTCDINQVNARFLIVSKKV